MCHCRSRPSAAAIGDSRDDPLRLRRARGSPLGNSVSRVPLDHAAQRRRQFLVLAIAQEEFGSRDRSSVCPGPGRRRWWWLPARLAPRLRANGFAWHETTWTLRWGCGSNTTIPLTQKILSPTGRSIWPIRDAVHAPRIGRGCWRQLLSWAANRFAVSLSDPLHKSNSRAAMRQFAPPTDRFPWIVPDYLTCCLGMRTVHDSRHFSNRSIREVEIRLA